MMAGPGKSHRIGISLVQLFDMFPDEGFIPQVVRGNPLA